MIICWACYRKYEGDFCPQCRNPAIRPPEQEPPESKPEGPDKPGKPKKRG